jgi:hypothetical protein
VASWFETAQERLLTMRGDTDVGARIQKRRLAKKKACKKEGPREAGLERSSLRKTDQAVLV